MKTKLLTLLLAFLALSLIAQTLPTPNVLPISVSVTGFVPKPGVYQMTALSRLSDALEISRMQVKEQIRPELMTPLQKLAAEQDSLYLNFQALRNVTLTRQGKTASHDLMKFLRGGDIAHNPILRDGDIVSVMPITSFVSIQGNVYLPGEYQYVPGDKLSDLLLLCQGFSAGADLKSVMIYRYRNNSPEFEVLRHDLSAYPTDPAVANIPLMPNDRVIIARDSESRRGWKVTVEGNVKAPGEYLIGENTTLYDVLTMCGGPTRRGDLRDALYIYGPYSEQEDPEFERLKELSITQMTPMEYNYLRSRMRQLRGKYSLNLAETWDSQGAKSNPLLRDGDYIFVPEQMDMVAVSGQVRNPGLVPWVQGKNWEYYIKTVGGFTNNRRLNGTRIIRHNSGNWVKPSKKLEIRPGDMIFVAEQTDRDIWTDIKDVVLLTSQVVTIFLSIRAITSK